MIIEHEAAGTLLKSTENRAGGFTCRINFYLVSSLPVPFSPSPFSSSPFLHRPFVRSPFHPALYTRPWPVFLWLPITFSTGSGETPISPPFSSFPPRWWNSLFTRTSLIFLDERVFCLSSSSGGRGERADERKEWKYSYRGGEIEFFIQFCAWTKSLQDDSKREIYESLNSVFFLIRDKKVNKRKGRKFRSISDNKNFSRKLE